MPACRVDAIPRPLDGQQVRNERLAGPDCNGSDDAPSGQFSGFPLILRRSDITIAERRMGQPRRRYITGELLGPE